MILAACAMFGCSSSNIVERDQILVPRVENVRIDGIEEEWGERGYRVEVFSDTAATLCGGWDAKDAVRLKHLPTWVFHGDNDTVVPLEESTKMVEGLKKVDGNVQFTIYPGVGHDSWTPAFEDEALWEWMLKQRRSGLSVKTN